jgi:hypothetical protein
MFIQQINCTQIRVHLFTSIITEDGLNRGWVSGWRERRCPSTRWGGGGGARFLTHVCVLGGGEPAALGRYDP